MKKLFSLVLVLLLSAFAYEVDVLSPESRKEWQDALKAMDEARSAEQFDNVMKMIPRLPNFLRLQSDYFEAKQPKIQVNTAHNVQKKGVKILTIDDFTHHVHPSFVSTDFYNTEVLPRLQSLFSRVSSAQKTVSLEFKAKTGKTPDGVSYLYWEPVQVMGDIITPFLREAKGEFAAVLLKPLEKFDLEGLQFGAAIPFEVFLYAIPKKYESVLKITPPNGNYVTIDATILNIISEHNELVGSLYSEWRLPEHTWLLPLKNAIVFSPFSIDDHAGDCKPGHRDNLSCGFHYQGKTTIKSQANSYLVKESRFGQDYLAVTYNRIIDLLYEHNLLPREFEEKLRKINSDLYWSYGRDLNGNYAGSYAAPADNNVLYIDTKGLSSEEITIIWLAQHLACKAAPLLMGIDANKELWDYTTEQHNKMKYAQAHLAITALNLMGYGMYTETKIESALRSNKASDKIGKWDAQRNILILTPDTAGKDAEDTKPEETPTSPPPAKEELTRQENPAAEAPYALPLYWQQELEGIDQASSEKEYEELLTAFAQKLPSPFERSAEVLSQPSVSLKNAGKGIRVDIGEGEANIYTSTNSLSFYNEHIFPRLQKLLAHFSKSSVNGKIEMPLKPAGRMVSDIICSPEDFLAAPMDQLTKKQRGTFVVVLMRPLSNEGDCSKMDSLSMEVNLFALPSKYEKLFRKRDESISRRTYTAFNLKYKDIPELGTLYCEICNEWKLKMDKGYAFMPLALLSGDGTDSSSYVYTYAPTFLSKASFSMVTRSDPYDIQLVPTNPGNDFLSYTYQKAVDKLYSYGLLPPNAYNEIITLDSNDIHAYASLTTKDENPYVFAAPFGVKASALNTSGMTDEEKTVVWIAERIAHKAVTHLLRTAADRPKLKAKDADTMIKVAQGRLALTLLKLCAYSKSGESAYTEANLLRECLSPRKDLLIGKWDKTSLTLDLSQDYKGLNEGEVELVERELPLNGTPDKTTARGLTNPPNQAKGATQETNANGFCPEYAR